MFLQREFRTLLWPSISVLFLLNCSCSRNDSKQRPRPWPPKSQFIRFEFAIYLPPTPPVVQRRPMMALTESLRHFPDLTLVGSLPEQPQTILIRAELNENIKDSYTPPSLSSLQYSGHGLSTKQAATLQKSSQALILQFAHPTRDVWTALRAASELVSEVATKTEGFVWDEETREVFTPEAWRQRRIAGWTEPPLASRHTVIHEYDTGHSVRAITLGMAKMGLPDIVVESSGWSSGGQIGSLINVFAQALVEGKPWTESDEFKLSIEQIKNAEQRDAILRSLKPNATKVGCLTLIPGKWEEGDPRNVLVQLRFDKYPGNDLQAKQERMVSSFFGSDDRVTYVKHNEELLAASARAKEQLPSLQKAFAAGLQPGEYIEVKAPFKIESEGEEWMWVEVTSWQGNRIGGVLNNDPERVSNLHSGQHVEVRQEDIFDYLHTFADKRTEGNTTGAIIARMQEAAQTPKGPAPRPIVPACDEVDRHGSR